MNQVTKTISLLCLFVVFTSNNGTEASYDREPMGSTGPFKGRKGSTFEGGMREPTVMYWPGVIPSGTTNDELMTTMDLLPTFAKLAGAKLPKNRVLDGVDIFPTLLKKKKSPHNAFYYYRGNNLQAIRMGDWKLHVKENKPKALYDVDNDIGESKNLLGENDEVTKQLLQEIVRFEDELGKNSRPAAFVKNPVALSISGKPE